MAKITMHLGDDDDEDEDDDRFLFLRWSLFHRIALLYLNHICVAAAYMFIIKKNLIFASLRQITNTVEFNLLSDTASAIVTAS